MSKVLVLLAVLSVVACGAHRHGRPRHSTAEDAEQGTPAPAEARVRRDVANQDGGLPAEEVAPESLQPPQVVRSGLYGYGKKVMDADGKGKGLIVSALHASAL